MYSMEFIYHKDILYSKLLDIIKIKSSAWNYPLDRQLSWINHHISPFDIHCILSKDGTNVAYLNLIDTELKIEGIVNKAYGVGNVCCVDSGRGDGTALMQMVNQFIKKQLRVGLLFCKFKLVNFYSRFDWIDIPHDKILASVDLSGIEVMLYNHKRRFEKLSYDGKLF